MSQEALKALPELADAAWSGDGYDQKALLPQAALRPALERLKADGFAMLVELTCVDYLWFGRGTRNPSPAPPGRRFKLSYRLMDLDTVSGLPRRRLVLECWVEDEKGPPSVRDLWPNADWLEREVWDMFGVPFGREGIKRLLMYEQFQGHPLRKDYPINKRQPLIGPKDERPRERMLESDLRPRLSPESSPAAPAGLGDRASGERRGPA